MIEERRDPEHDDAVEGGIALLSAGDAEAAIRLFDELLAEAPSCERALCGRGSALRSLGRHDEALCDYNAALSVSPNYARAIFNRGLTNFERGEKDAAFQDFDRALAIDPEPGFYFYRGQCFAQIEQHAQAIVDFERVIELNPSDAHAYAWLASQYCWQKEYERAISCLDTAIAQRPNDADLHNRRGCALYSSRDFESAVRDLSTAISLGANQAEHFHWRGRTWWELQDVEAAIADQAEAISRDDGFADAYIARGRALLARDDITPAIVDFNAAVHLKPSDAEPLELRALAHTTNADDQLAMADLCRALELEPRRTSALRARSQLHTALGNFRLAEADLDALAESQEIAAKEETMNQRQVRVSLLIADHFQPLPLADLAISERQFPFRVRADLQRAMEQLFDPSIRIAHFSGVKREHSYEGTEFSDLLFPDAHRPALAVPAQYEEVDIGESDPVRCLKCGLWLLEQDGLRFAVFLAAAREHGRPVGMKFQVAVPRGEDGARTMHEVFKHLEEAVLKSQSYRGKILSLEKEDYYSGMSSGIRVHKLRTVERDQVILPAATIELLDRNIIQFAARRAQLAQLGLSTKKGVLFYGPPGTGKTHTIHYLAGAMRGHTTLLITAEQLGLLGEYMTLARLLQPSIVVIEDADLIARDRGHMDSPCEEALLNKLLNEMDGLRPNTDVFFILTTNRPEALEAALASRPGRIDQAIEFPLPDDDGRRKLVRLYSRGLSVPQEVIELAVRRTERVSASFIKELMRRAAQFQLERDGAGEMTAVDLERALEELLFAGGSLNCRLLGLNGASISAE